LYCFALFVPVFVLFLQDLGLSLTQIMLLQSIYAIAIVLLEVPTGYFADIFGRKKSLIIGSVFFLLSLLSMSFGTLFFHFLIAEIFWALFTSLISGSDSALIYDTLKDLKDEATYKKVWGNIIFISTLAIGIANILGGFIGAINFRWTFYFMLPLAVLMVPMALSIKEPERHKLIFKKNYFFELLNIIKTEILTKPKLKWLILFGGIIYAFNQSALWFYQPYFALSGLEIVHFGFIFASFQLVSAFSSKYAYKVEAFLGEKYSLVMLLVLVVVSYFLMGNFVYLFSFSFVFLQQFVRGFSNVVIGDYIHKLTESRIRATILSVQSMFKNLVYAVLIPIFGYVADVYSLLQTFLVIGATAFVIGSIVLFVLHRNKVF
jgi:MFS family permease